MTRLAGELQTALPLTDALPACAEAIDGLGWKIEAVEASRIVSRAGTGSRHDPRVEVVLRESGQATSVRIVGTDTDAEPLSRDALIAELETVRAAIEASLATAAEAPPNGRPAKGRRRSVVVGGIVAGLLAIGLIAGIAIVNDTSEEQGRDRAGVKRDREGTGDRDGTGSTGASQPNQGQGRQASSQEPQASSPPALEETKEVRDGDQRFELTPTDVDRDGSYITVEIELTGLGDGGYDPAGGGFQAILLGSNGRRYEMEGSGGPTGCKPPTATLRNGRTIDGCLPFRVPQGVEADRIRYQPFFIGDDPVEWDLR